MDFLEHELEEILKIFRDESEEQIQKLNKHLLKLESNPKDYSAISELFREAHSLKGASRMIGLDDIQSIAHKLEDVLGLAKENRLVITSEIIDTLCKTVDAIASIINESIETRGKSETLDLQSVIGPLENIINSDNISFNETVASSSTGKNPEASSSMEFSYSINTQTSQEIKKLITQIRVNIEKLRIFSTSPDALEEFVYFISELSGYLVSVESQRVKSVLDDIKYKVQSALKGSGVLLDSEINEIENLFEDFVLMHERTAYISNNEHVEEVKSSIIYEKIEMRPEEQIITSFNGVENPGNTEVTNEEEIYDINTEIIFIKEHLHIFVQHTEGNIQKFDDIINKLNALAGKAANSAVKEIIEKISEILIFSKEKDIPLNQDILNVIQESYSAAVQIMENPGEAHDDPGLILQRIAVIQQMLKLSAHKEIPSAKQPVKQEKVENNMSLPIKRNAEVLYKDPPPVDEEKLKQFDLKYGETNTIKTLRVDTQKLDQLVNQVGELIIAKIKAKEHLNETEKIIRTIEEWYREWNKTKQYFRHIERHHKTADKSPYTPAGSSLSKSVNSFMEDNSSRLSGLMNKMNSLYKVIQEDDTRLNHIVSGLEEKIKSVRVLPLATIFHLFPRMVRDIARDKNKEIDFLITGSETSVDKKIIEEIKSPLMHIIRNSIDHGIETAEERIKKDKPPTGRILLGAYHLENSVLIEITDDGKGIDIASIKKKVLQKGLLTPEELEAMSEEQIMNIIFWPGFSTGETVTDISGRGIGLDIVYTKISQLNGKVKVKSTFGQGCQVSIQLPVTMATIKSFLVQVSDQIFAIPTSSIKTTLLVDKNKIIYKEGKKTIIVDDRTVPICSLAETLEMQDNSNNPDKMVIIVVQADDTQIGFIVNRLVGDQEILHKNLSAPFVRVRNVAGITTLGSGDLCLILNVNDLVKSAYINFGRPVKKAISEISVNKEACRGNVLVVDDSTTTRLLQRNILKTAGYNVSMASNGFEALNKINSEQFDIVITDVEMPEINGFELTERIRNSEKLKHIPVILVTSLTSEADKTKGVECGANAYIMKRKFSQDELLATVRRLIC